MYTAICYVTALASPWEEFLATKPLWPTGTAVGMTLGKAGMGLLVVAMLCAVISGINGFYMSASRLIYSMAKFNALPKKFSKLSSNSTPKNAILFILFISLFAPWFGREVLGWIVDMCSVGITIAYLLTSVVATRMSLKEGNKLIATTGILGIAVSIGFLVLLLVPNMPGFLAPQSLIMLGVWSVIGLLFFTFQKIKA